MRQRRDMGMNNGAGAAPSHKIRAEQIELETKGDSEILGKKTILAKKVL